MDVLTIVHFWRVRGVSLRRVTLGRVEIVQIWGDSRVFKTGLHWCERDVIAQFCFLGFCFVLFLFFCLFFSLVLAFAFNPEKLKAIEKWKRTTLPYVN